MPTVVDFTGVEAGGGGGWHVPEDDYRFKVVSYKIGESKSSGNPMVTWEFVGTEGKVKGKKTKDYTTLMKDSLWKLMNLFEALGFKVPQKKLDIEKILKKCVGKELGITLSDEEYNKKITSKPSGYLSLEDLEDADDDEDDDDSDDDEDVEEEAPKAKKKGKKKSKKSDDDDDEDEIEDLDLDEI